MSSNIYKIRLITEAQTLTLNPHIKESKDADLSVHHMRAFATKKRHSS